MLKKLFDIFLYGNIFIALTAACFMLSTDLLLQTPLALQPYVFVVFFSTLLVYNLHRLLATFKSAEVPNTIRHNWIMQYPHIFGGLVLVALCGFGISVLCISRGIELLLIPLGLITIGYSIPFIAGKSGYKKLRELPGLKTFFVAFVWAGVTTWLPALKNNINFFNTEIDLIFFERILFVYAITIPFDIRDMERDKAQGVYSIAVILGTEKSKILSIGLLISNCFVVLCHYGLLVHHSWRLVFPQVIVAITAMILVYKTNKKQPEWYFIGLLDGTMLLQFLLLWTFSA